MSKKEEYVVNRSRDMMLLVVGVVLLVVCLLWSPEWVWVAFPFVFTSLAGLMGRL